MFGLRPDGKKVKGQTVLDKAEPFFMPMRIDAVNYITLPIKCAPLDEFILRQRKLGNNFTYTHILYTALVRVLYSRPRMNRFIMRGTVYQRNQIMVTMDIKKELSDDGESVTLKLKFTGRESISEMQQILDSEISKNLVDTDQYKTNKFAKKLGKLPPWLFRWALAFIRWADKHGLLPNCVLDISPFHTSAFITNLKSLKIPTIYHHLYNFGTTSIFCAMGKEKMMPVVENNKDLKVAKILELGLSLDERVADGYYMGKTLRLLNSILSNPDCLLDPLPDDGSVQNEVKKKKTKKSKKSKTKTKTKKTASTKPKSRIKKVKDVKPKKPHTSWFGSKNKEEAQNEQTATQNENQNTKETSTNE